MLRLYHKRQGENEENRYAWFVYKKDLNDIRDSNNYLNTITTNIIDVKFKNFNAIDKDWLDGDWTDTLDLVNPEIKLAIKKNHSKVHLFVELPENAEIKWEPAQ